MRHALALASRGEAHDEVPVGCIIVRDQAVIGEGWNRPISSNDPTAHAEIIALRTAAQNRGNYRLTGATLYVTLEPCLMCAGAMVHARIARLVFGASDPKRDIAQGVAQVFESQGLNHRVEVCGGVLENDCVVRLKTFFQTRRRQ